MSATIDIGLLWHSDCNGNLGIGALTLGNMALVRQAAARAGREPRFHLFQAADREPSYIDGVHMRHEINARFVASGGYARALKGIGLMLDIGAGDSFTDIYPDKRFAYHVLTKELCLAKGVPLVFSPQTIGPFSRQPHRAVAARLLRRAAHVFARDPLSEQRARELAPEADITKTVDVAFALPHQPQPKGPGVRFGLNVSGLLMAGGHSGRHEFGMEARYDHFVAQLIEALLARGDVTIELISHVYSRTLVHEDDLAAARQLQARYPALVVAPRFRDPSAAKSYISGLDFLTGARMHATIAAFSAGVPVVPMSYSVKFEGLYGGLDYPWLLPVRGRTAEQAMAFVLDAFDRREQLAADIARSGPRIEAGLEAYVGRLAALLAAQPQAPAGDAAGAR